ncbi:MAG TPA: DUF5808 domain-containing protein [Bryobacteraceae bacterium]|nr:DUF5808 domain-containing protein [Bryobacteraceae bacterium]
MSVSVVWIVPVLVLVAGLQHLVPQLTRPGLFFAVTVSPEFRASSEGRGILLRYRLFVWASTLIAIGAALAGLAWLAILLPMVGYLWGFLHARHTVLAYAAAYDQVVEVELDAPPEGLPGGPIVALLPIAALAALGGWAAFNLDRLPARMAVHWGLSGPDAWVTTTSATVFGFLAVYATLCLLLAGVAWGLLHGSRRIATTGRAAAGERLFRRRLMQLMIIMEYLLVCPAVLGLLLPAAPGMTIWGLALTAVIVVFAILMFRSGQGGTRAAANGGTAAVGDRTPDACWKLGMFYVNPADPSILVEKRFGIGYTVNLGNCWSWAALGAVLVPAALGLIFLRQ